MKPREGWPLGWRPSGARRGCAVPDSETGRTEDHGLVSGSRRRNGLKGLVKRSEKKLTSSAFVGIRRVKDADTKAILTSAPAKQGLGMGVAAQPQADVSPREAHGVCRPGPRRPRESGRAPARGWRAPDAASVPGRLAVNRIDGESGQGRLPSPSPSPCVTLGVLRQGRGVVSVLCLCFEPGRGQVSGY